MLAERMGLLGFSIFAQTLYDVFSRGMSEGLFTKALFESIYNKPTNLEEDPLDKKESTFRSYLWGGTSIDSLCKKLRHDLDLRKFAHFLTDTPNPSLTRKILANAFKPYISDINEDNCVRCLSSLFFKIIQTAAGFPEAKVEITPCSSNELSIPELDFEAIPSSFDKRLLLEAGYHCTFFGCRNSLYVNRGSRTSDLFRSVVIDDTLPSDDYMNTIAMCPECAELYSLDHTPIEVDNMKARKQELVNRFEADSYLSSQKVVEGIERLLRKASSIDYDCLDKQTTDPVEVRQKIERQYGPFFTKVNSYAVNYFNDIEAIQKRLVKEKVFSFEEFKCQIHAMYEAQKMQNLPQPEVFNLISKWLSDSTGEPIEICEAVVSYFIQICEVFDVISE